MSGRYKAYGEYKDSGVEWLGEVPQTWEMWKLAHAFEVIGSGTTPSSNNDSWFEGDIPWVTTGELRETVITHTIKKVSKLTLERFSALKIHPVGSVVIAMYGATIGRLGILGVKSTTNQACCVLTFSRVIDNKYLYYWLGGYKDDIIRLSSGGGQPNINQEKVASLKISSPILKEQTQIAAFLDHETAKIDTLIDKQQQLIELLKEKRQAVISHTVTKGLDPDVPMKDSGVDWLGEVPEHWKVLAIKKIVSTPITDGPHETPNFIEEGVSFISAEAISSGVIDFSKQRACISIKDHIRFSEKYKPHLYDIYMVKSGATTGVSAIVETINDFNIWSPLAAIRCSEIAFPYFVLYFLRSQQFLTAIELNWSFGTQQNIGMGVIGNIYISCPPIKEAIMISDHIRQKCSKIENLITLATHQISLMQERRTALISAAVTGKIDVRDWQILVTQTESDEVMA